MEMLVVLIIIGLMSSAVILTFPEEKSGVDRQAQTFLREVNAVAQEAIISGQSTALGVSTKAYAFYVYSQDGWIVRSETDWDLEARPAFRHGSNRFDLTDDLAPLIVFEPLGLSEPFALTLSDLSVKEKRPDYTFISKGDGRITLERGS